MLEELSPKADVVVEGGGEGSRSSILETSDAGATWTLLADPCQGLSVEQLLAPNEHTWLLYCYMGGGMNQGISEVWHSSDHGGSWKIVARSDEGDDDEIGNIGDVANDLLFSGNKQIIFGLVDGGAAGRRRGQHQRWVEMVTNWRPRIRRCPGDGLDIRTEWRGGDGPGRSNIPDVERSDVVEVAISTRGP